MSEYISKDAAFQRLLCKESEFHHWNDYNLAQYIIAQIVPEDVVPATHIQKLGNIVQTIKKMGGLVEPFRAAELTVQK